MAAVYSAVRPSPFPLIRLDRPTRARVTDATNTTAVFGTNFTITPQITLSLPSGAAGTVTTVTGNGFAATSNLTFKFKDSANTTTTLTPSACSTPAKTDTHGTLPGPSASPSRRFMPDHNPKQRRKWPRDRPVTDASSNSATATFTVEAVLACGSHSFSLPANTTVNYTLVGAGGGNGAGGGSGGAGADVAGTLDNTTASAIGLTVNVGCQVLMVLAPLVEVQEALGTPMAVRAVTATEAVRVAVGAAGPRLSSSLRVAPPSLWPEAEAEAALLMALQAPAYPPLSPQKPVGAGRPSVTGTVTAVAAVVAVWAPLKLAVAALATAEVVVLVTSLPTARRWAVSKSP